VIANQIVIIFFIFIIFFFFFVFIGSRVRVIRVEGLVGMDNVFGELRQTGG